MLMRLNSYDFEKIDLGVFEEPEAVEFLKNRTKREDVAAKSLVKCLGCFPLALEQAAAYIVATPTSTCEKYILDYKKKLELAPSGLTNYNRTIYATLQLSIDKITVDGALQMLNMCAYFEPERIPVSWFDESRVFSEVFDVAVTVDDVVAELVKYSLVQCDKDNPEFLYMHGLVQDTVRRKHEKDVQWLIRCFNLVCGVFDYKFGDEQSMVGFVQNVSHALKIAQATEAIFGEGDMEMQEKIAGLYHTAGYGYHYGGQYIEALKWYVQALVIREKVLGKDHPGTASTYNNLANVYADQGRYDAALEWYGKARVIREKVLGKDHPGTADTYNNLAVVYADQGRYDAALEWYGKARVIREKVLGKDHPDTATTYNNIAIVYCNQGRYDAALEWHGKALVIYEKVFGKDHKFTKKVRDRIEHLLK
jgi:tetratricopeptide (TPR) repeat protein